MLPSTEYSPTSTTISCVPVWRLQSAHLHSECALFPVGHGKHLRELPYCNYQFFVDPGGFKPVENLVYLKSGIFCFNWPFTSQTKSLETPLALPWVHWDEHPAVLSNLVPQPGASMNAPYFPQSLLAQHVLFVGCCFVVFSTSNPSYLYIFVVRCVFFRIHVSFKGFGISARSHVKKRNFPHSKNWGFALQDGLMGRWHPNNVEKGTSNNGFLAWNWIWDNIYTNSRIKKFKKYMRIATYNGCRYLTISLLMNPYDSCTQQKQRQTTSHEKHSFQSTLLFGVQCSIGHSVNEKTLITASLSHLELFEWHFWCLAVLRVCLGDWSLLNSILTSKSSHKNFELLWANTLTTHGLTHLVSNQILVKLIDKMAGGRIPADNHSTQPALLVARNYPKTRPGACLFHFLLWNSWPSKTAKTSPKKHLKV